MYSSDDQEPFRMAKADQITDFDRASLMDHFGLVVDTHGNIEGLTTHPDFAFFLAVHHTGVMTARLRVTPCEAASMMRTIADVIELEDAWHES